MTANEQRDRCGSFPFGPLDRLVTLDHGARLSHVELGALLGVTDRQIARYRAGQDLRISRADQFATTLGWHPILVWPDRWYAATVDVADTQLELDLGLGAGVGVGS